MSLITDRISDLLLDYIHGLTQHLSVELGIDESKIRKAIDSYEGPLNFSRRSTTSAAPIKEGIVIILNYGPGSHAIFGETKKIKDKLMSLNVKDEKLVSFNKLLAFGPGWTIRNKKRLQEVEDLFEKEDIEYEKIDRADYESEEPKPKVSSKPQDSDLRSGVSKVSSKPQDSDLRSGVSKKKAKITDEPTFDTFQEDPKKKKAKKVKDIEIPPTATKATTAINKWGNYEEPETGIVFMNIPADSTNKKSPVAIGTQDTDADEDNMELQSVCRLTKQEVEICKKKGWRYLTTTMGADLTNNDEDLAFQLAELNLFINP